jgi:hypothetical protein
MFKTLDEGLRLGLSWLSNSDQVRFAVAEVCDLRQGFFKNHPTPCSSATLRVLLETSVLYDYFPKFIAPLLAARKSLMENQL